MLSIGKLSTGRASYYTEQLPGGADEYYISGGTEAPAVWLGSAAGRLGLSGRVDTDGFRRLLAASHPVTGEALGVPRTTANRRAGYDLCFSAPKSVSVLWALAPAPVADMIVAGHDCAVEQAVAALEAEVVRARRGHRAANLVTSDGILAAAFGHRSSRAGDPQIHTHLVVPNLTVTGDGRWSALAGDRLYGWAKTLGYLYQAVLRSELTQTLGVSWGPVTKGAAEIEAVAKPLLELFSTRRAEITAALDADHATSRRAGETAALATRRTKDHDLDLDQLRTQWHRQARRAGLNLDPPSIFSRPSPGPADRISELADRLLDPDGLCANRSSFDRRDLLQALAAAHRDGIGVDDVIGAATAVMSRPEVVPLATSTRPGGPRYSTTELLEIETALVSGAAQRRAVGAGLVPADLTRQALAGRPSLTLEQTQMVVSLTSSGAGVEVVVGRAGSGKTYALDAARAAWTAAGHHVIGAAIAARAAAELQAGAGIPSDTVDRLLGDLDRAGPLSALRPGSVVVIDEAAMVGTRKLARLAAHAERAGAKLVLVGDHRQLPEIEAGGAFAALQQVVQVHELAGNRRQSQEWERHALAELRAGSVPDAITAYHRESRVHLAGSADAVRQQMVTDWWAAHQSGEQAAMYALRRIDVDELNERARRILDHAGRLGPHRLEAAGREFAVGDEVLCLRNDRRLAIRNGTRSSIAGIDQDNRTITLADGAVLPAEYLDRGHLGYSYATTVHRAQGATVDRAFLLGSDTLFREAGYVGLSRARHGNHLYIVTPGGPEPPDPVADTIRHLGDSRAQTVALHQVHPPKRPTGRNPEMEALLADPPAWLRGTLGPPPATTDERQSWARTAGRIAAYRDIYRITDAHHPIGPAPDEPDQRRAWELAAHAIDQHRRSLELEQERGIEL